MDEEWKPEYGRKPPVPQIHRPTMESLVERKSKKEKKKFFFGMELWAFRDNGCFEQNEREKSNYFLRLSWF